MYYSDMIMVSLLGYSEFTLFTQCFKNVMPENCKGFFDVFLVYFQVMVFLVAIVGLLAESSQKYKLNSSIVFDADC